MFKNLQNKIKNFTSYLLGYDKIYKEVEDKLKQAKNDKERIAILEEGLELSKEAIQRLVGENSDLIEENARLKEQLKEHEDLESILSGSGSSDGSINSQRQKEREKIVKKIQTSKGSTASERKMLKYLDDIEKLENQVKQKDQRIKEMEQENNNQELVDNVLREFDKLDQSITQTYSLIENPNKDLK